MHYEGVIHKYKEFLPVTDSTPVVTLLEGNTPLIKAYNISDIIGSDVYLKYEGLNPTGSFKDRGMTMAVSKALEKGEKAVICASTGNTSASAAAYSARCKLNCVVLIPEGAIAMGKLSQALIHDATVLAIKDNFDKALELVKEISAEYPFELVNSINPYRIEGQKTGSFEICDQLQGRAPDVHCIPVGNAGNITAYWKGYKEYKKAGKIKTLPKMWGFQAEGAAPIVKGEIVKNPETIATAIRIGNPASWGKAENARDESGGLIDSVTDEEIIEAYKMLASREGIFAEPASAASVAGLLKMKRQNKISYVEKQSGHKLTIICILTGHGLKDPDRAIKSVPRPKVIEPAVGAVLKEVG